MSIVLFSECMAVRGYSRSVICDFDNRFFYFIPNSLVDFIEKCTLKSIKQILQEEPESSMAIIHEYIEFLIVNELAFLVDSTKAHLFQNDTIHYSVDDTISNGIVDIKDYNATIFVSTLSQFNSIGCFYLQLRFLPDISKATIDLVLLAIRNTPQISFEIVVNYTDETPYQFWVNTLLEYENIIKIFLFNNVEDNENVEYFNKYKYLISIKEPFHGHKCCGEISTNSFAIEKRLFFDNMNGNSCLKNKISIDQDGNIKNCPSSNIILGNIQLNSLGEVLANSTLLKSLWNISKKEIDVCKICEFRLMCLDCRAFLSKPNDEYSKPLKCGYDPFTGKWEKWSTNPLNKKAIVHYSMQDLVTNYK